MTALTQLLLVQNNLTGTIPWQLNRLTALTRLYLSRNYLTGSLPPGLDRLTSLQRLYLDRNQLTGLPTKTDRVTLLPNDVTRVVIDLPASLTYLNLTNNQLSGRFPTSAT